MGVEAVNIDNYINLKLVRKMKRQTLTVTPGESYFTFRCGFFSRAFGRDDPDISQKLSDVEAYRVELGVLEEKREKLDQKIMEFSRLRDQLLKDIELAKKGTHSLTASELLARAHMCFKPSYSIHEFSVLPIDVFPFFEIPMSIYWRCSHIASSLRRLVQVDEENNRMLCGYAENAESKLLPLPGARFPVEAFREACKVLQWPDRAPVFTLREEYTIEEIEREYGLLEEVKKGRKKGREASRKSKRTIDEYEDVYQLVNGVLRDMPKATVSDQNEEIRHRSIAIRKAMVSFTTADRWRKSTIKRNRERRQI